MFSHIIDLFPKWVPEKPSVLKQTKNYIELCFSQPEPFSKLEELFLYRVQTKSKILGWVNVYSGGKTSTIIHNLEPGRPHKFRLKILLRTSKISSLQNFKFDIVNDNKQDDFTLKIEELTVVNKHDDLIIKNINEESKNKGKVQKCDNTVSMDEIDVNCNPEITSHKENNIDNEFGNKSKDFNLNQEINKMASVPEVQNSSNGLVLNNAKSSKCIDSQWSEQLTSCTYSEGPTVVCFCMAVRCGYTKQVHSMLEERPELIDICNTTDGFTPLATAVRKGNTQMVRYLLNSGADVDQKSSTGETPLHLAVYAANISLIEAFLERGADIKCRDRNGLSLLHYAAESGDLPTLRYVLKGADDVNVRDNKGWTPLHRAVLQGAPITIIQELLSRGADVDLVDCRGLTCAQLASLLKGREDIQRLVDKNFVRDKAVINFTKLTKKLSTIHSLLHK